MDTILSESSKCLLLKFIELRNLILWSLFLRVLWAVSQALRNELYSACLPKIKKQL